MYKRRRIGKQYRKMIVGLLRQKGGELPVVQVKEELGIQTEADRKAFERAVRELLEEEIVRIENGKLVLIGYGKPQEITLSVGGRRFRISAPVERGRVINFIHEKPVMKVILRRKGIMYRALKTLGLIEEEGY